MRIVQLALLALPSICLADGYRESLRGEKSFPVVVEYLGHDLESDGLNKEQLRTDIELKLRLAGVKVLGSDSPGDCLRLNITAFKNIRNIYAYFVNIEFRQGVIRDQDVFDMQRLPDGWKPTPTQYGPDYTLPPIPNYSVTKLLLEKSIRVATWWDHMLGTVGAENVGQTIRGSVKDSIDRFLNDWLAANAKP